MWNPLRRPGKPHERYKRACPGTGRMGVYGRRWPYSTRRRDRCPVCGKSILVRRYRNRAHGWPKGSLRLHMNNRPQGRGRFWTWLLNGAQRFWPR